MTQKKIILTGGAGLVGQNLIFSLKSRGYADIVVIDKYVKNLRILKEMHPDIQVVEGDFTKPGGWEELFSDAKVVILMHAQIGGKDYSQFYQNNVVATNQVLKVLKGFPQTKIVHISSSVVNSVAADFYSETKKIQERMVIESGLEFVILRPTLMFGWFDRKHLGWLSRMMKRTPFFPIPGNGKFLRQPLFVGDFCKIIVSCIENSHANSIYNISGLEFISYYDLIFKLKEILRSRVLIFKLPYKLFYGILYLWGKVDPNPPFTINQLKALVAGDCFEVIDWPLIFNVKATSFNEALKITFSESRYSKIILHF